MKRLASVTPFLVLVPISGAQAIKLSGPLARTPAGDVVLQELTPGQNAVVYVADQEEDEVYHVYLASLSGRQPALDLSGPVPGIAVRDVDVAPEGDRVAYSVDIDGDQSALFGAPIDGSQPPVELHRLQGEIRPNIAVARGGWVVYLVRDENGAHSLYRVRIEGAAAPILLASVDQYRVSPDEKRVVYVGRDRHLYSITVDGSSGPVLLDGGLAWLAYLEWVQITPDGQSVLFVASDPPGTGDHPYQLHSVPITGGVPRIESGRFPPGGGLPHDQPLFQISPDGRRAVHLAIERPDGPLVLHSVPLDGRRESQLLSALPENSYCSYEISPDGTTVVFTVTQFPFETVELYRVPIDRAEPALLDSGAIFAGFAVSQDHRWVVYAKAQELFRVATDGAEPKPLHVSLAENSGGWQISADSATVVVVDVSGALVSVPIDAGSGPVELSSDSQRAVTSLQLTPTRAVYRAHRDLPAVAELFSAPIDGGRDPVRLNGEILPMQTTGDVSRPEAIPGTPGFVYVARGLGEVQSQLYATAPGSAPVKLNAPPPPMTLDAYSFLVDSGGTHLAYRVPRTDDPSLSELFALELDGPGAPVHLVTFSSSHLGFPNAGCLFADDGRRVVYRSGPELFSVPSDGSATPIRLAGADPELPLSVSVFAATDDVVVFDTSSDELFAVPIDGSARPRRLHPPLPAGRGVVHFTLTPDGTRAVCRVSAPQRYDLWSVRVDGSARPVRLNDPSDDLSFAEYFLSPDSRRVVYLRRDLFSVPIDGGTAVRLSAMPEERRVIDVRISADGRRVCYRADQDIAGVVELYGVPVEGGVVPRKLSGALSGRRDVWGAEISADGTRVVYLADQDRLGCVELYSVPFDGSREPVKLHPPLPNRDHDVTEFAIAPDGDHVVYLANLDVVSLRELYATPIDGGDVRKLHPSLSQDRRIWSYEVLPDHRVSFVGELDEDDVGELYLSVLPDPRVGSLPADTVR